MNPPASTPPKSLLPKVLLIAFVILVLAGVACSVLNLVPISKSDLGQTHHPSWTPQQFEQLRQVNDYISEDYLYSYQPGPNKEQSLGDYCVSLFTEAYLSDSPFKTFALSCRAIVFTGIYGYKAELTAGSEIRKLHLMMRRVAGTGKVDAVEPGGAHAAHFAYLAQQLELTRELVRRGCDPNAYCLLTPQPLPLWGCVLGARTSWEADAPPPQAERLALLDFLVSHGAVISTQPDLALQLAAEADALDDEALETADEEEGAAASGEIIPGRSLQWALQHGARPQSARAKRDVASLLAYDGSLPLAQSLAEQGYLDTGDEELLTFLLCAATDCEYEDAEDKERWVRSLQTTPQQPRPVQEESLPEPLTPDAAEQWLRLQGHGTADTPLLDLAAAVITTPGSLPPLRLLHTHGRLSFPSSEAATRLLAQLVRSSTPDAPEKTLWLLQAGADPNRQEAGATSVLESWKAGFTPYAQADPAELDPEQQAEGFKYLQVLEELLQGGLHLREGELTLLPQSPELRERFLQIIGSAAPSSQSSE